MNFRVKKKYNIQDLVDIMALLRAPDGCPWDIKQTHESIRKNFIEETYEVVEAIDKKDRELLCEELGDVLLQVVFHSRMEEEAGGFTFDDVCDGICKKLIVRHPHIFSDVVADTPEEVLKNWDAIKRETKGQSSVSESMMDIPAAMPALIRAEKIQKKASNVGFDWKEASGAVEKLREEVDELDEAIKSGDSEHIDEELGDLLFSAVNVSRLVKSDPEVALAKSCDKFTSRFKLCEKLIAEQGLDMTSMSLEELDSFWDKAKIIEKQ